MYYNNNKNNKRVRFDLEKTINEIIYYTQYYIYTTFSGKYKNFFLDESDKNYTAPMTFAWRSKFAS